ncbi:cytidine deaminase [Candidatus Mycoplasma pogonae]
MYQKLTELLKNSYAPYSNFPVAAILVDSNNKEWKGVNVENAAFPSGLCAERSALFGAVSHGFKVGEIKEIHIISKSNDFISPCAACRQVMTELMPLNSKIYQYRNSGEFRVNTLSELVPYPIRKKDIE